MLDESQIQAIAQSYGERQPPDFVVSATVASELGQIIELAKRLSLSSKNANVITLRAGDWGLGFTGLTQFIDEYARRTIDCAQRINITSRAISRRSVRNLFDLQVQNRIRKVSDRSDSNRQMLTSCQEMLTARVAAATEESEDNSRQLMRDISEMKSCIRALASMVPICRIEAARAGPYKDSLSTIADVIENQTHKLQKALGSGQRVLELA